MILLHMYMCMYTCKSSFHDGLCKNIDLFSRQWIFVHVILFFSWRGISKIWSSCICICICKHVNILFITQKSKFVTYISNIYENLASFHDGISFSLHITHLCKSSIPFHEVISQKSNCFVLLTAMKIGDIVCLQTSLLAFIHLMFLSLVQIKR